jgi:hypothetical protein
VHFRLVCVAVLALCACSSTPRAQPRARGTRAVLLATVHTSGALSASDDYTVTTGPNGVANCHAASASGNSASRQFTIRSAGSTRAPVYFELRTVSYHGPATYRLREVQLNSITAIVNRQSVYFYRDSNSAASMTIDAGGSGTASFSSFRSTDGRALSGTVSWRCETLPA